MTSCLPTLRMIPTKSPFLRQSHLSASVFKSRFFAVYLLVFSCSINTLQCDGYVLTYPTLVTYFRLLRLITGTYILLITNLRLVTYKLTSNYLHTLRICKIPQTCYVPYTCSILQIVTYSLTYLKLHTLDN